jgi:hypothetical protein
MIAGEVYMKPTLHPVIQSTFEKLQATISLFFKSGTEAKLL